MTREARDILQTMLQKPVAVFGGGVSGGAAAALVRKQGGRAVIYDRNPDAGEACEFGPEDAARHRLVIFSPGFAPTNPWLVAARAQGCLCLGEMDYASLFWKGEIVAVTGTNGKTTLTEFLACALNKAGRRAYAVGNIGEPLSRLLLRRSGRSRTAVCEVSSFQAEALQFFRANAVLWTNFSEDHLDRHGHMADYFRAKWQLVDQVAEDGIVCAGVRLAEKAAEFGLIPRGRWYEPAPEDYLSDRLEGTPFQLQPQIENFALARLYWRQAGYPEKPLYAAARAFRLAPHRLAVVGEADGVTFWNDSKATNFDACLAAIRGFDSPVRWIGGGKSKGGDLGAFVLALKPSVAKAYLIGETARQLESFCRRHSVACGVYSSLEDAVHAAYDESNKGEAVVLSPAFASFDMFSGFGDRGTRFIKAVEGLTRKISKKNKGRSENAA